MLSIQGYKEIIKKMLNSREKDIEGNKITKTDFVVFSYLVMRAKDDNFIEINKANVAEVCNLKKEEVSESIDNLIDFKILLKSNKIDEPGYKFATFKKRNHKNK